MKRCTLALTVLLAMLAVGCSDYRDSADQQVDHDKNVYDGMDRAMLDQKAHDSMERLKAKDPVIARFFDTSYAWVIFPEINKGGVGIGGAHGLGVVYEHGSVIGYVTLSQATIGPQLGGETYSEVIFFHDQDRLDDLKMGRYEFGASASVAAASDGAIASADYKQGVAVFTQHVTGLMFDASIGGQKFGDYEAK